MCALLLIQSTLVNSNFDNSNNLSPQLLDTLTLYVIKYWNEVRNTVYPKTCFLHLFGLTKQESTKKIRFNVKSVGQCLSSYGRHRKIGITIASVLVVLGPKRPSEIDLKDLIYVVFV